VKKRLLCVFLILFGFIGNSYGLDNRISSATVRFEATGPVVTFNSVTNHIYIRNESPLYDCYVDIKCVDNAGTSGHVSAVTAFLRVPAKGKETPNSVEFDYHTSNLSFIGHNGTNSGYVYYIVTGDRLDL